MIIKSGFQRAAVVATLLGTLGSVSCGDVARTGRAPAFLVLDTLKAASGAATGQFNDQLESDVVTNGSVFEDLGQAQVRVLLKDQGQPGAAAGPSNLNWLKITRYRVVYRRADGRNTPGVDVPYPFDGAVTITVTNQPAFITFPIVRAQAKVEAPLFALRSSAASPFGGGAMIISTLADITFYGDDLTGNAFQGGGSISINFADWADPPSGGS